MKRALTLTLLALGLMALASLASVAYAQTEYIELTESDPPDGARLIAPPETVHLCFSHVIRGDFRISYKLPSGPNLDLRISFLPNGRCLDVQPTPPDNPPEGEHTLEWQVAAAAGSEEGSGELRFQIGERVAAATQSPAATTTPPPATPPAEGTTAAGGADGDGPDILLTALVTTASVGGAAVLLTLGYLLRRRIGFEPHRPPPSDEDEGGGGEH
ncbi:MAG: copper resistance protein CopC [Chloroflexi bacterium]|nr:copper resistance protein CopC [Chloroflexota bacterium]